MNDPIPHRECEGCHRERELFVASLIALPYSAGMCKECYQNNALPMWAADYMVEEVGDGGLELLIDEITDQTVFVDGEYITMKNHYK